MASAHELFRPPDPEVVHWMSTACWFSTPLATTALARVPSWFSRTISSPLDTAAVRKADPTSTDQPVTMANSSLEGLMDPVLLIVVAVLFGLAIITIHNQYEKNPLPDNEHIE